MEIKVRKGRNTRPTQQHVDRKRALKSGYQKHKRGGML